MWVAHEKKKKKKRKVWPVRNRQRFMQEKL
jgi:hypothetical protein